MRLIGKKPAEKCLILVEQNNQITSTTRYICFWLNQDTDESSICLCVCMCIGQSQTIYILVVYLGSAGSCWAAACAGKKNLGVRYRAGYR